MYSPYFGFREKPFNVTPDPRFFYTNPVYQEAYATLLYGIRDRKGFVVLTGEVGTGKTTLLRRLMDNLEASAPFVFIYNSSMTFGQILSFTCQELGLPVKDKKRLDKIQALNEFLITQLRNGGTGVLLIDEAQNLGEEVLEDLRLLSNLETGREKLLQIVLVGQPELETKLDQPKLRQFKQRVALRCRLDRLTDREVGPFIDFRLRAVGYEGSNLFTIEAIRRIALHSKGIPRLINIICDNALLLSYGTSQKTVSAKTIEEVVQDLRLKEELAGTAESQVLASGNGKKKEPEAAGDEPVQPKWRQLAWVGVGTFLVLLLGGGGAMIYPLQSKRLFSGLSHKGERIMGIVGERLEFLRRNLNESLAVLTSSKVKPEKVQPSLSEPSTALKPNAQDQGASNPKRKPPDLRGQARSNPSPYLNDKKVNSLRQETSSTLASRQPTVVKERGSSNPDTQTPATVELILETKRVETGAQVPRPLRIDPFVPSVPPNWRERPILIKRGATISEIAYKVYGSNTTLAMDLIKEFNPHIENLNWVIAGEKLLIPPFTREILLRKQPDNSYHLILASLPTSIGAAEFAQVVRDNGYKVVVAPQRVSDNLLLHRVEIGGLKDLEAANEAWDTALANRWLPFAKNPRGRRTNEGKLRHQTP